MRAGTTSLLQNLSKGDLSNEATMISNSNQTTDSPESALHLLLQNLTSSKNYTLILLFIKNLL